MVTYGNAIGSPAVRFIPDVLISSATGSPPVSALTDELGNFTLIGFGSGSYVVAPSKSEDQSGAITAFDAGIIIQHVIGVQRLTGNPLAVADVNGNGIVNSFDAGLVAAYVNASPTSHALVASWRFFPANRTYSSITGNMPGQNYSALLVGDVTGNWGGPGVRGSDNRPGTSGDQSLAAGTNIAITLPNITAPVGKEILAPVRVQNVADKNIIAYEFQLRYDPSVVQPASVPVDVGGTVSRGLSVVTNAVEPGLLRVVVYGGMPINENGVLLNLKFTAVGAAGTVSPVTFERLIFNEGKPQSVSTGGEIRLF